MNDYPLTIFHDGSYPICRFDIANLQARNQNGHLRFIDIAAPGFDAAAYGRSQTAFSAEIHARRPDGSFVFGMEVFRLAYRAVGLGGLIAPADWRLLRKPADALYRLFARHRPGVSRRVGRIFETMTAWQASRRARRCKAGLCALNEPRGQA